MIETEVLIVGGGPAGSSCAWRLRQHGVPCVVVDQAEFPRVKPCAGWITPEVVKDLKMDPSEYPYGFNTFQSMRMVINTFTLRVPTRQHAIRRVEFDRWLLDRSSAPFFHHAVKTIREEGGAFVVDDRFKAKFLVGAGGTYCPVNRILFKADFQRERGSLIAAMEEEFPYPNANPDCWLWFWKGLPGYAWFVPKANGVVNVGIGAWADRLKTGPGLKEHWQQLVAQLDRLRLVTSHRFEPVGHSYYLRQPAAAPRLGSAFLVGDSAGLATLDMGEGIGPAVRSGIRAADAIATGTAYSLEGIPRYTQGPLLGRLALRLYRL